MNKKRVIFFARFGLFLLVAVLLASPGCNTCMDQQKRGPVTSGSGHVNKGTADSVLVSYDSQGTQNDVQFEWTDKAKAGAPILQIYATSADCMKYDQDNSACVSIGQRQGTNGPNGEHIVDHITISTSELHGATQYRLQVIGDPLQGADYSYSITWFSGPDC